MRLTVLGGGGAVPTPERGCSGYLLEYEGFRLLIDPGHATVPRLLERLPAEAVDAVLVTHGHADHCADLNPLLRARHLSQHPPPPLPLYALPGALEAVLALDGSMLTDDWTRHDLQAGAELAIGPFDVMTADLPHFVPNIGVRLSAGGASVAYTGDSGPSTAAVDLAHDVDLFLAEATFPDTVPAESAQHLNSAAQVGRQATAAGARRLLLTHLWPGADVEAALSAARASYHGPVDVARPGLAVDIDRA